MTSSDSNGYNNGNGNGREKVEISFPREEYKALEKCAAEKDESINSVVRQSVKNAIHKDELRKIVSKACEDGKLSEDSKACKYVEKDVD
jgi:hypothetical protein